MKLAYHLKNLFKFKNFNTLRKFNFSTSLMAFYKIRVNRYSLMNGGNNNPNSIDRPHSSTNDMNEGGNSNESKVFIRNLPYNTSKEEMYELLSSYGEVEDIYIPWDKMNNTPRTFCFARFKNPEIANSLVQTGNIKFKNRTIYIASSNQDPSTRRPAADQPRRDLDNELKIVVKNIPYDATIDELKDLFSQFGPCFVNMPRSHDFPEQNRGFAFIKFDTKEAYDKSYNLSGYELRGRKLNIVQAGNTGPTPQKTQVMIKNLDFNTTKEDLAHFLQSMGIEGVDSIRMPVGQSTPNRGFAFVSFGNEENSAKLLNLDGHRFKERTMSIIVAENRERGPMSQRQPGSRSRYQNNDDYDF